jgi:hypothetical protein
MILVLHSTVAGSDEWMVLGGVGGPNWKRSVRRRLRIVFRTFLCSLEVRLARYRAPREPQYKIYGDPVKRTRYVTTAQTSSRPIFHRDLRVGGLLLCPIL